MALVVLHVVWDRLVAGLAAPEEQDHDRVPAHIDGRDRITGAGRRPQAHDRRRGRGHPVVEMVGRVGAGEVVFVPAVQPVRRRHLGLDPRLGAGEVGELHHPVAHPWLLLGDQLEALEAAHVVAVGDVEHQVDVLALEPLAVGLREQVPRGQPAALREDEPESRGRDSGGGCQPGTRASGGTPGVRR